MATSLRAIGDGKDMTLDELAQFVEDARKAGVPGDNPVRAEVSTSQKIKEVTVALGADRS